jgi:hypothetical protein
MEDFTDAHDFTGGQDNAVNKRRLIKGVKGRSTMGMTEAGNGQLVPQLLIHTDTDTAEAVPRELGFDERNVQYTQAFVPNQMNQNSAVQFGLNRATNYIGQEINTWTSGVYLNWTVTTPTSGLRTTAAQNGILAMRQGGPLLLINQCTVQIGNALAESEVVNLTDNLNWGYKRLIGLQHGMIDTDSIDRLGGNSELVYGRMGIDLESMAKGCIARPHIVAACLQRFSNNAVGGWNNNPIFDEQGFIWGLSTDAAAPVAGGTISFNVMCFIPLGFIIQSQNSGKLLASSNINIQMQFQPSPQMMNGSCFVPYGTTGAIASELGYQNMTWSLNQTSCFMEINGTLPHPHIVQEEAALLKSTSGALPAFTYRIPDYQWYEVAFPLLSFNTGTQLAQFDTILSNARDFAFMPQKLIAGFYPFGNPNNVCDWANSHWELGRQASIGQRMDSRYVANQKSTTANVSNTLWASYIYKGAYNIVNTGNVSVEGAMISDYFPAQVTASSASTWYIDQIAFDYNNGLRPGLGFHDMQVNYASSFMTQRLRCIDGTQSHYYTNFFSKLNCPDPMEIFLLGDDAQAANPVISYFNQGGNTGTGAAQVINPIGSVNRNSWTMASRHIGFPLHFDIPIDSNIYKSLDMGAAPIRKTFRIGFKFNTTNATNLTAVFNTANNLYMAFVMPINDNYLMVTVSSTGQGESYRIIGNDGINNLFTGTQNRPVAAIGGIAGQM